MESKKNDKAGNRQRLSWVLGLVFLFALLMGPGPGLWLINDLAAEGGTFLGMPVLYVWAVGWLIVEAAVVVIANLTIWREKN